MVYTTPAGGAVGGAEQPNKENGKLYENKMTEWDIYRTRVTELELQRFLPIL